MRCEDCKGAGEVLIDAKGNVVERLEDNGDEVAMWRLRR